MAKILLNNTYQFSLYKEKLVSKGRDSKPRAISIPTNRDKLLLKFLQLFLKETYKDELAPGSIHTKINDIKQQINNKKYNSFIKLDVRSFLTILTMIFYWDCFIKKKATNQFIHWLNKPSDKQRWL